MYFVGGGESVYVFRYVGMEVISCGMERYFKNDKEFIFWIEELLRHIASYDTGDVTCYDKLNVSYTNIGSVSTNTFIWPLTEDILKIDMHNILGITYIYVDATLLDVDAYDLYCDTSKRKGVLSTYYLLIEGNTDMLYFFGTIFNALNKSDKLYINFVVSSFGGLELQYNLDFLMCNELWITQEVLEEMIEGIKDTDVELTCTKKNIGVYLKELFMLLAYYKLRVNKIVLYSLDVSLDMLENVLNDRYSDWINPLDRLKMFKDFYTSITFIVDDEVLCKITHYSQNHKKYICRMLNYNNSSLKKLEV